MRFLSHLFFGSRPSSFLLFFVSHYVVVVINGPLQSPRFTFVSYCTRSLQHNDHHQGKSIQMDFSDLFVVNAGENHEEPYSDPEFERESVTSADEAWEISGLIEDTIQQGVDIQGNTLTSRNASSDASASTIHSWLTSRTVNETSSGDDAPGLMIFPQDLLDDYQVTCSGNDFVIKAPGRLHLVTGVHEKKKRRSR